MIIKIILIVTMFLVNNISFSQSSIAGKWKNTETGSIVEIYNQKDMLFGKIIKVTDNNSKEKVGHILLNNLVYNKSSKKYTGEVKSTNGMTAFCEIEMLNHDQFQLTVRKLFIKKKQIFEKTE